MNIMKNTGFVNMDFMVHHTGISGKEQKNYLMQIKLFHATSAGAHLFVQ